ncbi:hypothetical protein CEXT_450941 [Caerostris extrusa]|uniref:Uncharacterized protein n=1 Tax=Caerostris extrusa TaxID=172846 RepID=A0AAV4QI62_CAEEX|nr:hypothetical protein CEXT_450941 [Caerostris extrusa]
MGSNQELLFQLEEEKLKQTLLMEQLTKKLFIERENCLGLRRTIAVEEVGLQDYVTDLLLLAWPISSVG